MTTMTTYADELREIHAVLNNRQPSMAGRLLIIADAIDAHLAKAAQDVVPTEMNWEEAYCAGRSVEYMHGWNACRQAALSQRGEAKHG